MPQNTQGRLRKHLKKFAAIGVALSAEKDIDRLLEMIVVGAMDFTNADGGTLYLTDENADVLRFAFVRNKTLDTSLGGRASRIDWPPVPLQKDGATNTTNVSAYSATTQEVVNIPDVYEVEDFDFTGTREYDKKNDYRSKSMLVVPMKDHEENVIGVLQLINALAEDGKTPLPFTPDQQEIVESLASQAAVALNNAHLIRDLKDLFRSLITSIGTAIDEKSPYTGGHVRSVAGLATDIANAVNDSWTGPEADKPFDEYALKEIQMAAWLHDIGKVTTPESILDKRKKLEKFSDRAEIVNLRYEIAKLLAQVEMIQETVKDGKGKPDKAHKEALRKTLKELDKERDFVLSYNEPNLSPDTAAVSKLRDIARERETLTDDELHNLCIGRGTLTAEERKIVENHAAVTKKMLSQLHFPRPLAGVPFYAGSHHEMLDGSGYPEGLSGDEIPIQARILAVADIFEALTARRPYKEPMPLQKAISILNAMANEGKLDRDVIQAAVEQGVFDNYTETKLNK